MIIKEYKGYKYIVYSNNDICFNGDLYFSGGHENIEKRIKNIITRTINYYKFDKEKCNKTTLEYANYWINRIGGIINDNRNNL
jgi:hypothetical protein